MKQFEFYVRLELDRLIKVTAEKYNEELYLVRFNAKNNKSIRKVYNLEAYGLFDIKTGLNVVYCNHTKDINKSFEDVSGQYYGIRYGTDLQYMKLCEKYKAMLEDLPLSTLPKFSIEVIDDIDED